MVVAVSSNAVIVVAVIVMDAAVVAVLLRAVLVYAAVAVAAAAAAVLGVVLDWAVVLQILVAQVAHQAQMVLTLYYQEQGFLQ